MDIRILADVYQLSQDVLLTVGQENKLFDFRALYVGLTY